MSGYVGIASSLLLSFITLLLGSIYFFYYEMIWQAILVVFVFSMLAIVFIPRSLYRRNVLSLFLVATLLLDAELFRVMFESNNFLYVAPASFFNMVVIAILVAVRRISGSGILDYPGRILCTMFLVNTGFFLFLGLYYRRAYYALDSALLFGGFGNSIELFYILNLLALLIPIGILVLALPRELKHYIVDQLFFWEDPNVVLSRFNPQSIGEIMISRMFKAAKILREGRLPSNVQAFLDEITKQLEEEPILKFDLNALKKTLDPIQVAFVLGKLNAIKLGHKIFILSPLEIEFLRRPAVIPISIIKQKWDLNDGTIRKILRFLNKKGVINVTLGKKEIRCLP